MKFLLTRGVISQYAMCQEALGVSIGWEAWSGRKGSMDDAGKCDTAVARVQCEGIARLEFASRQEG